MLRVHNLYVLSCAHVPRIVFIILAFCKLYNSFFYSLFISYLLFIILFIIYFIFILCPQLASAKYIDTWIKFIFIIIIITARKDIVKIIVLLVINLMGIHRYLQCKFSIWVLNFACLNFTRIYFRGSLISQFFFTITTLKTHRIKCQ